MEIEMIKDSLSDNWHSTWDSIYKHEGALTDEQIEKVNRLLQPMVIYNGRIMHNPLSCFFTSYYEDARDINLARFLDYFFNGEIPYELPELKEVKSHENWPFGDDATLDSIPVPVHRYKREVVQDVFDEYVGIGLDELTGVGFDEVLYLESTDAYYNFTSDAGVGWFICAGGKVEDGVVRLYRESESETYPVLTIVKSEDGYAIDSFSEE